MTKRHNRRKGSSTNVQQLLKGLSKSTMSSTSRTMTTMNERPKTGLRRSRGTL